MDLRIKRRRHRKDAPHLGETGQSTSDHSGAASNCSAQQRRELVAINGSAELHRQHALCYVHALMTTPVMFLHLSKSGGTALCELAKVNGCFRVGAGGNSFTVNCADKSLQDGPWWLPVETLRQLPVGVRRFASANFAVPPRRPLSRSCLERKRDRAHGESLSLGSILSSSPSFSAIEGAMPEKRRCDGFIEMVLLREPISRLASFGRELRRWNTLPENGRKSCANFTRMLMHAPAVYDNQIVRALLGYSAYTKAAGAIGYSDYLLARRRLQQVDVLLLTGSGLFPSVSARLGWRADAYQTVFNRKSRAGDGACEMTGLEREAALAQNQWDMKLFREAEKLFALDERFFQHSAVRKVLARATQSHADFPNANSPACGLLSERMPSQPSGLLPSICKLTAAQARQQGLLASTYAPCCIALPPNPQCVTSGGSSGAWDAAAASPELPAPFACILPPAGRASLHVQTRVQVPPFRVRWSHATCALACQPDGALTAEAAADAYGLEDAGRFCFCLLAQRVRAHSQLHPAECTPPCVSHGGSQPGVLGVRSLPCGGVESVAVFKLAETVDALASPPGATREAPREAPCAPLPALSTPSHPAAQAKGCVPVSRGCRGDEAGEKGRSWTIYAHAWWRNVSIGTFAATVGCFAQESLHKIGTWSDPRTQTKELFRINASTALSACMAACSHTNYFGLSSHLQNNSQQCACYLAPNVAWQRDRHGLHGLEKWSAKPR